MRHRYCEVRDLTEQLAAPLSAEDQTVQSMADTSPTKWHRAHTTWFFEEFLLVDNLPGYQRFNEEFCYLFNSYYEAVGPRHPRPTRGLIARPGIDEVAAYRRHVDAAMGDLLDELTDPALIELVTLGFHHEQQHQELLLMDIKHALAQNVLDPVYRPCSEATPGTAPLRWIEHEGGLHAIGFEGPGFSYDNESPRHSVWLEPFALASRAATAGDLAEFIADGGYRRPELWLSDGWATVVEHGWEAPLYWQADGDGWSHFTLAGRRAIEPTEPACHLSYYEADAFARWSGARLPTEAEWEVASADQGAAGKFLDLDALHPRPATGSGGLDQLFGDVWEWTASAYLPYPGFQPAPGAVGEYNGKFMVNQHVLRGGACVTPPGHLRPTYRNFFPPGARWAFSGLRLARNLES